MKGRNIGHAPSRSWPPVARPLPAAMIFLKNKISIIPNEPGRLSRQTMTVIILGPNIMGG
jgi:hypothetical protein